LDVWDGTKAGMAEDACHHKTLRYHFPSVKAFRNALRDDLDDAALNAGWNKVQLVEGGVAYEAYFRDVLQVIRGLLKRKGDNIQLWSGVSGPAPPSDKRETPMDGDAFKLCEELVMKNREELACVLGLHVFSDSSQLSWSGGTLWLFSLQFPFVLLSSMLRGHLHPGHTFLTRLLFRVPGTLLSGLIGCLYSAHKLYPVRVRLVNDVSRTVEWVTVAYIPVVQKLPEPAADERARIRRCGILQRVLYTAFTNVIGRSHIGFHVRVKDHKALAFPRILLYICDQPEERAVLGLRGGQCAHPCTSCMAKIDVIGAPQALNGADRNVINTLTNQVELYEHTRRQRQRRRRLALGALDSTSGGVPGLAAMAGLGTAPHMLYNMIGFDVLHVCSTSAS